MIDLSICMVSLNCEKVIGNCLDSLPAAVGNLTYEVILVDNGSKDQTVPLVRQRYPWIKLVEAGRNAGFVTGTNLCLEMAHGRQLLWLNCDIILHERSLKQLVERLDQQVNIGVIGPKVLNPDGSFQPQCKRGLPTPLASLAYFTKLDNWWRIYRPFGQYLLRHLDPDRETAVDAVSGCCLLARREVYTQIGPLDTDIFAYGEDIDWCVRAQKAGWLVWYYPGSTIIHLKGQGGAHSMPLRKITSMHDGMWVFYQKHLADQRNPVSNFLVYCAVKTSLALRVCALGVCRGVRALSFRRTANARTAT